MSVWQSRQRPIRISRAAMPFPDGCGTLTSFIGPTLAGAGPREKLRIFNLRPTNGTPMMSRTMGMTVVRTAPYTARSMEGHSFATMTLMKSRGALGTSGVAVTTALEGIGATPGSASSPASSSATTGADAFCDTAAAAAKAAAVAAAASSDSLLLRGSVPPRVRGSPTGDCASSSSSSASTSASSSSSSSSSSRAAPAAE
mmetsp:Transcript_24529/g.57004  ORF Transcript_24529/g.57004 Transcript_24529/m.57004 type:complete len:200 (-) Transcript_24529:328-927(-)